MEEQRIALIVGGGIATEITPLVLEILDRAGARFDWQRVYVPAGSEDAEQLLENAVDAVKKCGIGLKTKLLSPKRQKRVTGASVSGSGSPNVQLRLQLGLYAGVRPIKTMKGLPTRYPDLDLILIRENTEDIYKGIEHELVPGVVQSAKVVTREACERIARYAFRIAREHGREHVTFIHKGNIMKKSDGLFMQTVRGVAAENSDVGYREMIVDAACMHMVLDPYQFDVILTGNLYGDILSSLGSGLAGGISSAHSINLGDDYRVFEAIHGDAEHLVGTGKANPLPLLSPAVALVRHFDEDEIASRIEAAVSSVLEKGEHV
ncbi:MAG: isocitrate/isopropylmalate family dehydrogenase, partial [Acidobacteriota bacterium]